ncbi:MAG: response regulator [Gemmatimonadaceae bacterium]|nr:response regulator [Gemmatimonadaceae bacterium]
MDGNVSRSAALLDKLSSQVPGVIYQFLLRADGSSCFPFASVGIADIYEVTPADVREDASPVFSRLHPEDLARVAASISESARELTRWQCEYRVELPTLGLRWLRGDAKPERLDDGSTLWHGYIGDITAQQLAREALAQSEARYRVQVEYAPEAIIVYDADLGTFTEVNSNAVQLFGYPRDELLLKTPMDLCPPFQPDGRPSLTSALDGMHRALEGQVIVSEWTYRHADGHDIPCEVRLIRLPAEGRRWVRGSIADISAQKRLQGELLQAKKMESVGRLAGGIAHDFNNLLTIIRTSLDLALSALGPDDVVREDLAQVADATTSAASLTQQLLAFSRRQIIAPIVLDVNAVVQRVSGMLQRVLGEQITLRLVTAPRAPTVRFDPGQLEQILVNLAINARDAMPSGGQLTIEVRVVRLEREQEFVQLLISDTGLGMSADVRERAFEPFFTTKPSGQGTGLGLAMIHGAVSQNGGSITLDSEEGHGTRFTIHLPRVAAPSATPTRGVDAVLPTGTETIVVAEDDERVRTLMARLLTRQGYTVHAFDSAEAVLDWLVAAPVHIDLLLTDVIMPGMNGKELAHYLRVSHPQVRVLYASGYTADVVVTQGVLAAGVHFLAKPFTAGDLAAKVRDVLDRPIDSGAESQAATSR